MTRRCMEIQKELGYIESFKIVTCDYCDREFTKGTNRLAHMKICKLKDVVKNEKVGRNDTNETSNEHELKIKHLELELNNKINIINERELNIKQLEIDLNNTIEISKERDLKITEIEVELNDAIDLVKESELKIKHYRDTLDTKVKQIHELEHQLDAKTKLVHELELTVARLTQKTEATPKPNHDSVHAKKIKQLETLKRLA